MSAAFALLAWIVVTPVGAQPHGRPYQPRHVSGLGGVELNEVLRAALA